MKVSAPPPEHALTNEISEARRQIERSSGIAEVIEALRQGIKILLQLGQFRADGHERTGTLALDKRDDHEHLAPAASIFKK